MGHNSSDLGQMNVSRFVRSVVMKTGVATHFVTLWQFQIVLVSAGGCQIL